MNLTTTGRLTDGVLLSYRTPADSVEHLLPDGLELVTRGKWAFWNVVACRVEAMRPAFPGVVDAPHALGVSYHHVAYRLLVQAMTDRVDVHKGLYFVRSDADARVLGTVGNWLTDFQFHPAVIDLQSGDHAYALDVTSTDGRADAAVRLASQPPALPTGSCFPTLSTAAEFLRYPPLALATDDHDGDLRIAEVQRDERAWRETPVSVVEARFGFFDHLGQTPHARLELATRVAPMDYVWKLGRRETLLDRSAAGRKPDAAVQTADTASP